MIGKKLNNNEFIEKAKLIHGSLYDYSSVKYINARTKINIICKTHGEFTQKPYNHLNGSGCIKCWGELTSKNQSLTTKEFINESMLKHGKKYDYSKSKYLNYHSKIKIICSIHGEFEQMPSNHLLGKGCKKCGTLITNNKNRNSTEDFISKAKNIHHEKYEYTKVKYINTITNVNIICKKHGSFKQKPSVHLKGHGCPICSESRGEINVREFLNNNEINFIPQKRFPDCKFIHQLPFDFYLPDYNMCIEYNGEQHYKEVNYWGGIEGLKNQKIKDKIKMDYCLKEKIELLIIKYDESVCDKLNNHFNTK
jgi:hypothetical protein